MIKYFIWGAGEIGKRFITHVPDEDVLGFIDNDVNKIGTRIDGKPVISFREYMDEYNDSYIVVCVFLYQRILEMIQENNLEDRYFLCTDFPGEWFDIQDNEEFIEHIKGKIEKRERQAIYGFSLYSLYLAEWIRRETGKYPVLISDNDNNDSLIRRFQSINDGYSLLTENEVNLDHFDIIYNTSKRKNSPCNLPSFVEMYNCSDEISKYTNDQLCLLKNRYSGKRCFIVATGPSLKIEDLDVLHSNQEICLSMNSIFKCYPKTHWRPDYWLCGDISGLTGGIQDSFSVFSEAKNIFLSDSIGEEQIDKYKNLLDERFAWFHIHRQVHIDTVPQFSTDVSKGIYYGGTITYICLQLAAYMGFNPIYLLGVDYSGGKKNSGSKYTHFYEESVKTATFFEPIVEKAYLSARDYADSHNIQIINATRGGELEFFERADFDSLF